MKRRITNALPYVLLLPVFVVYGMVAAAGCGTKDGQPGATTPADTAAQVAADLPEAAVVPDTTDIEENVNYTASPNLVGWVTAITLNVRGGPGTSSNVVGYLFKGDHVDIFETRQAGGNPWYRVNDAAGYVDGWVYGRYVSGAPVKSDFVIPADYKEPRTPTALADGRA